VELGMHYVRNSILNTMLGKTIKDRVPRYRYFMDIPQLCFDDVAWLRREFREFFL